MTYREDAAAHPIASNPIASNSVECGSRQPVTASTIISGRELLVPLRALTTACQCYYVSVEEVACRSERGRCRCGRILGSRFSVAQRRDGQSLALSTYYTDRLVLVANGTPDIDTMTGVPAAAGLD